MPTHILIGPMGAGKSTIGAMLAKKLGADFLDTDQMVEARAGKSIGEIFVDDGEELFRALESDALKSALASRGVISLGGGACISSTAQDLIRNSDAEIIFLDISLSRVADRIGFDKARPLLAINPRSQWQKLMDERRPIYANLASRHILVDDKGVDQIVTEILER